MMGNKYKFAEVKNVEVAMGLLADGIAVIVTDGSYVEIDVAQ